jgi:heat-inducible transcriptional repressor
MASPVLDERSRDVLKSLIQLHIATGAPVGSESLCRTLDRPLSPATIRNIMADLERTGYLDHPHTSAGRMPTDEGYRVYVDSLMSHQPLPSGDAAVITTELHTSGVSPHEVMDNASHLLSRLSHQVGFVLAPEMQRTSFRHVDLVRLPPPRILVVMVSGAGLVTHKVIEMEDELSQDDLQACTNYLNAHFTGMTLATIRARLLDMMGEEVALYDLLLKRVVSVGERAFAATGDDVSVYLDGASNMLEQAEFEDLGRMRSLLRTFEEKDRLVKILNACLSGGGVRVIIGHENPDPELRAMTVVTASYSVAGEAAWGLGVMGSTRMPYARVMALVDHVARTLARTLQELRT